MFPSYIIVPVQRAMDNHDLSDTNLKFDIGVISNLDFI